MLVDIYAELLGPGGDYHHRFAAVHFAVLDTTRDGSLLPHFERLLAGQ